MKVKKLVKDITFPLLKSRPDFLIIGAQKAGTTSLYNYLIQHPQILNNNTWKEIRYYDLASNYSQGFSWYLGNFPFKFQKGNKLTLDASPSYLYFPDIPQLIKQDLGNIPMIAILRNPVDRAYSAWKMYHSFGTNPNVAKNNRIIADPRTFSEAIEQELNNTCPADIYPYDYVGRGRYVEQLANYYNYFNRANILVLSFEQLCKDLTSTLNEICDFLHIKRFLASELQELQEQKYNVGNGKKEKNSDDEKTLEILKEYFAPWNEQLYTLLNTDYNW